MITLSLAHLAAAAVSDNGISYSQVRNEIAVLKRVSMGHQNILTLVDYFETMNNRTRPPPSPTRTSYTPEPVS